MIVRRASEDRFAFDLEHLLIAKRLGFGIAEVGVAWTHVDGGTVRPIRDGVRMLGRAVVIRARHLGPVGAPERARETVAAEVEAKPTVGEPVAATVDFAPERART
jgi:hypothetical protein